MPSPYQRGLEKGRSVRDLQNRNIFANAENPYKAAYDRSEWERGFNHTYYGREHPKR